MQKKPLAKIVSEEEAFWTEAVERTEKEIKAATRSIAINEYLLVYLKKQLEYAKNK